MLQQWSDDYRIGIDQIDTQHKTFFDATHRLYDAIMTAQGEHAVEEALAFLRNYAAEHFGAEEAFMKTLDYPQFNAHKKLHADFIEQLGMLTDEYDVYRAPSQGMADQILEVTQDWLIDHIIDQDTLYARYLKDLK